MARESDLFPPKRHAALLAAVEDETHAVAPELRKCGKRVVYQYLEFSHVVRPKPLLPPRHIRHTSRAPSLQPFSLDYFEVVASLCDQLGLLYDALLRVTAAHPALLPAAFRIDVRIQVCCSLALATAGPVVCD